MTKKVEQENECSQIPNIYEMYLKMNVKIILEQMTVI